MRNIWSLFSKFQIRPRCYNKAVNSVKFYSNEMNFIDDILDNEPLKFEKCINEVKLLGRVVREPLFSNGNTGKQFVHFILATNRSSDVTVSSVPERHIIFSFNPTVAKNVSTFVKKDGRLYISGKLGYFNDQDNKKVTGVMLFNFICFS